MSKDKFTAAEWELVKDAPYWVYAALAAADGKVSFFTRRRENKALDKVLRDFKTANPLIEAMIADDSDPAKATENATMADAEKALNRIAALVNQKMGADGLDAMNAFLMQVGNTVAAASKEGGSGTAKMVSEKEAAALKGIEKALMKTGLQTQVTTAPAATAPTASAPAPAAPAATTHATSGTTMGTAAPKRDDDAKEKLEKARREAEERQKEANAEREAKTKAEAREKLEAARQEAEDRQKQATAEREAKAKAEAEAKMKAEAEAKAKAEAESAQALEAAEAKAAAPKYTQFIAEHTVQPGDNLSFISQRYYGTQANFLIIYEANRDVIGDNKNLIKPGQVLKIPKL